MATHKAYRLHGYGGRENITLDDAPVPAPGPGQVLVEVNTVAINPFDWKIREGYVKDEMPLPLPYVMGVDFVGRIVELGEGATRFKVGDRVMTMSTSLGAFAEHIAIDEAVLAAVPDDLSDEDAATLPIPAMSARVSLRSAGELPEGAKILIHGASGVVGALAVQFAKQAGAYVIGTASAKNRDYVTSLGADEFIDYTTEQFEDRVKDVDVVLDYVLMGGTDSTTDRSWSVLKPGGTIVSLADPAILSNVPEGYHGYFPTVAPEADVLEEAAHQLADGTITTKVARVFSRAELLDAMDLNQAGGTTGRLIVDFKKD
ncbi:MULTISPECIES: NADP-dependent oxidoreductase [unclassified Sphingomonas]|uniref:NADP-dependent oxidoreductase n=1 Tax=unclassified Sphingomonas TaxID=196159 RepID=UPI00226A2BDF|nr:MULTISPECIES: NADP-dependent oxidoreductase [unclassified Sphingomonas]